jgi:hypothetical protein
MSRKPRRCALCEPFFLWCFPFGGGTHVFLQNAYQSWTRRFCVLRTNMELEYFKVASDGSTVNHLDGRGQYLSGEGMSLEAGWLFWRVSVGVWRCLGRWHMCDD